MVCIVTGTYRAESQIASIVAVYTAESIIHHLDRKALFTEA
jgi:hypothetical protein